MAYLTRALNIPSFRTTPEIKGMTYISTSCTQMLSNVNVPVTWSWQSATAFLIHVYPTKAKCNICLKYLTAKSDFKVFFCPDIQQFLVLHDIFWYILVLHDIFWLTGLFLSGNEMPYYHILHQAITTEQMFFLPNLQIMHFAFAGQQQQNTQRKR